MKTHRLIKAISDFHLSRRVIIVLFLALLSQFSFAQKETSIWFFDLYKGLDFNYEPPKELYTPLGGYQATKAVMADKNGQLLFFTNSWQVYNAKNQLMDDGIILNYLDMGSTAHMQNVLTIPVPNSTSQYYIISSHLSQWYPEFNQDDNMETLHYAIVDLNYNSGLGKVISKKNVLCDSMNIFTVIGDRYNRYGWLIAFQYRQNNLKVFKISNNDITLNGEYETDHFAYKHIRSTPNSKKILLSSVHDNYWGIEILDFDLVTGEIKQGDFIRMVNSGGGNWINDFECSPDSRFIYAMHDDDVLGVNSNSIFKENIYRYDLNKGNINEIESSRELIFEMPDDEWKANNLQLNWRGEIVIIYPNSHFSLIKNPNNKDNPEFVFDAFHMVDNNSYWLNHYPSYFFSDCLGMNYTEFGGSDQIMCAGTSLVIGDAPIENFEYQWYPDIYLNNSSISNPTIQVGYNSIEDIDTINYIVTLTDTIGCVYLDTVNVVAKPAFKKSILGAKSVCPGQDSIAYWITEKDPGATYIWSADGGDIIDRQSTDSVLVNWGVSNYDALIDVNITNRYQCTDQTDPFRVKIYKVIDTELPNGPDTLNCLEDTYLYQVLPKHGSFFDWKTVTGNIIEGYGTNRVWIYWLDDEKFGKVWIDESINTELEVCFGRSDTLTIINPKAFGNESIYLYRVSSTLVDSSILLVDYSIKDPVFFKDNFQLKRMSDDKWTDLVYLTKWNENIGIFEPNKNERICNYQIVGYNICDSLAKSDIHQNILLQAMPEGDSSIVRLFWNNNPVWSDQHVYFDIYRVLDNENDFSKIASTYDTLIVLNNLKDGFNHKFFVIAENQTVTLSSMSNIDGFEYKHPVFIPNVFTPNQDGYNDYFEISNVELYKENVLVIYNRYGKELLRIHNYNNTWNGGNLPPGIYYYQFNTNRYNQLFRGWVSILR